MTNKLTATQQSVLKIAAKRDDRAIRWPERLRGGAVKKVAGALVSAGLARYEGDVLVATDEGLRAAGFDPDRKTAKKSTRAKGDTKTPRATRADSKQARLIEMLKRKEGASIEEIVEAFGWQPHTVRGAIAGALKKKLGLDVISEKVDGRRVYRIAA